MQRNPSNPRAARRAACFTVKAAALALICAAAVLCLSAKEPPTEYEVKAAYLYNFGNFVKWPGDSRPAKNQGFLICVLGQDPFGATLDKMVSGESIDGKSAEVKRVNSPRDADTCNIVFVGSSERGRLAEVLPELDRSATLTVSDIPGFTNRGGMIEFVLQADRVRFRINLPAAQHAGLNLSSELLKVASDVKEH